jgi:hypothetical protein
VEGTGEVNGKAVRQQAKGLMGYSSVGELWGSTEEQRLNPGSSSGSLARRGEAAGHLRVVELSLCFGCQDAQLVLLAYSCCSPCLAGGNPSLERWGSAAGSRCSSSAAQCCRSQRGKGWLSSSSATYCTVPAAGANPLHSLAALRRGAAGERWMGVLG